MKPFAGALLRLRAIFKGGKFKGDVKKPRRGGIITGWAAAAEPGANPVTVDVHLGGEHIGQVRAALYRRELAERGMGDGRLGFEIVAPARFFDGVARQVTVTDAKSGRMIAKRTVTFSPTRGYSGFESFMRWAYFQRYAYAPFSETDKRCLAFMDWQADRLQAALAAHPGEQPLVSIIMATYNRAEDLPKAVRSILAQSYAHWELLLVDDGSTDATPSVVAQFSDPRIRPLRLAKNAGVSVARNRGLSEARGELIAYLDSDNWWDPRFLSAMVMAMRQNKARFAYCGQYLYRGHDSEKPFGVRTGPFNPGLLGNRNYIDLNVIMHSREILEQSGNFDPDLNRQVDWELILRLADVEWPLFVPVNLSFYLFNQQPGAISTSTNKDAALDYIYRKRDGIPAGVLAADSLEKPRGEGDVKFFPLPQACRPEKFEPRRGVSVIIPSFNIPQILERCVAAVFERGGVDEVEVILCDNGSGAETLAMLDSLKERFGKVKVERLGCNYGFTYAVNRGLELAEPGNDIVILNNDAIGTQGWLAGLCEAAESREDAGIVAPQQVLPAHTQTSLDHAPLAMLAREVEVNVSFHHDNLVGIASGRDRLVEVSFVPFFCVFIKRSVLETVGALDELRGRHYRSDRIYCEAVRHVAGLKIYVAFRSKVYHLLQQSTDTLRKNHAEAYQALFVKNDWSDLKAAAPAEPWN